MPEHLQYPHTGSQEREEQKRERPGGGKAGRVAQKGGAPTSNKATGGKHAR